MKQELRLGDCYALAKHKLKQYTIRYISLLAVVTSMCLYAVKQVSAQTAEPAATAVADIKPLQIGDTIPEYLWRLALTAVNQPDGNGIITLNDYRGKTILLDFLLTSCGGCIKALPELEKVSSAFDEEVAVIAVTPEKQERVVAFIPKNNHTREVQLPFVVEDHILKQYFPHQYISHLVWISEEGQVRAFTKTNHVTARTIREFQSGVPLDWPVKTETTDFFNAPMMTLNTAANSMSNNIKRKFHYTSITGYTDGVGSFVPMATDSVAGIQRMSYRNIPILNLYLMATEMMYKIKPQEVIWEEGLNPTEYSPDLADLSRMTQYEWYQRYAICYERTVPLGTPPARQRQYLLADLNNLLNLYGRLEKRDGNMVLVISKNHTN